MEDLRVRFFPEALAHTPGLDAAALVAAVRILVRGRHNKPRAEPQQGPPDEEAVIRSLTRGPDGSWHARFGYWRNRFPSSRFDKSESAEGDLLFSQDGGVSGALGPLRDRF